MTTLAPARTLRKKQSDQPPAKPTYEEVEEAIAAELGAKLRKLPKKNGKAAKSLIKANEPQSIEAFVKWLEDVSKDCRRKKYKPYYVLGLEYDQYHIFLKVIVAANEPAKPGSAHELLEKYVLDFSRDEFGLRHGSEMSGGVEYCTVAIELHKVS